MQHIHLTSEKHCVTKGSELVYRKFLIIKKYMLLLFNNLIQFLNT